MGAANDDDDGPEGEAPREERDGAETAGAAAAPGDFKAFVGGLSWETTDEGLELYFSQFGKIVAAEVMRDRFTGQSRCFGFVSFAGEEGLDVACKQHMHNIDGKEVEVKVAFRKERAPEAGGAATGSGAPAAKDKPEGEQQRASAQFNDPEKKIFVGGLLPETKEEDLIAHFSKYGPVQEAVIKYDEARRSRGFAFVTFETLEGVEKASEQTMQNLLGKRVEIKRHKKSNVASSGAGNSGGAGGPGAASSKSPTAADNAAQRKKYADRTFEDIYAEYFDAVARGRAQGPPGRGPPPPRGDPDRDMRDMRDVRGRDRDARDNRGRGRDRGRDMSTSRSPVRNRDRSRSPGRARRMHQGGRQPQQRPRGGRR